MTIFGRTVLSIATLLALPGVALAHPGHAVVPGFAAGLVHPFGGVDHLAVMLLIGFWGAMNDARYSWLVVPLVAVSLAAGFAGAVLGAGMPLAEIGIVGSLAVLGGLSLFRIRLPRGVGLAIVAAFGALHGYVHGIEVPSDAGLPLYAAGLVAASVLLMAVGLAAWRVGSIVTRLRRLAMG